MFFLLSIKYRPYIVITLKIVAAPQEMLMLGFESKSTKVIIAK